MYDSLFALKENSVEDKDYKVTLLDIKENLKNYSIKELKSLAAVLIDNVNDLTKDKKYFKINLKKLYRRDG